MADTRFYVSVERLTTAILVQGQGTSEPNALRYERSAANRK